MAAQRERMDARSPFAMVCEGRIRMLFFGVMEVGTVGEIGDRYVAYEGLHRVNSDVCFHAEGIGIKVLKVIPGTVIHVFGQQMNRVPWSELVLELAVPLRAG